MVRATVAFAVVALGAAAVIAQGPELTSELDARDYSDLEIRALQDMVDMGAREPEFFDELEAREYHADQLEARDFAEALEDRDLAPSPSLPTPPVQDPLPLPTTSPSDPQPTSLNTPSDPALPPSPASPPPPTAVTITETPTPTTCTDKELKGYKKQEKVKKAVDIVRAANGKTNLSKKEKLKVKKAKKYLRSVRKSRAKAVKRTNKKCKAALRKAGLKTSDCTTGTGCQDAFATSKNLSSDKCKKASSYLKTLKAAKKAEKKAKLAKKAKKASKSKSSKSKSTEKSKTTDKSKTTTTDKSKITTTDKSKTGDKSKATKEFGDLLPPTKTTTTVGEDGVTTVTVEAPGPTCTPTSSAKSKSKLSKKLVARDIVDEEFESVFAREYDFDNLD
jgi:hypothetical protein